MGAENAVTKEYLSDAGRFAEIYWGAGPWNGAKRLWEILDIPDELLQYKDRIADYRINLLDVHSMENQEQYDGERKVPKFLQKMYEKYHLGI